MFVPVKWLKEYVSLGDLSNKELQDRLIMSGSNTEGSKIVGKGIEHVVVGKIESIAQHPNADKLFVMQVNVGEEVLQIVTGAQNCYEGAFVPVALNGAWISGGIKIKRGKLRGEVSNGMLCSLEELGIDVANVPKEFDDGILLLGKAYPLGMDIFEAIELGDEIIEFEITPNRPDCLSILGMAREASATFDVPVQMPEITIEKESGDVTKEGNIIIESPELCSRYTAKVVKNVKIESSPLWMQYRLINSGMRPINNIVDITNYVMLEYGQPIHAFDLDTVKNHEIIVRNAKSEEKITTLDGEERSLTEDMLVIADEDKAIAIAGVMGGENTEISDATQNIIIEVAAFNKSSVRQTSKKLGLRTEASSRYEKGISANISIDVVNRVCHLIEKLGAGEIVEGILDVYPTPEIPARFSYRPDRIRKVIGVDLTDDAIIKILDKLNIATEVVEGVYYATSPVYRLDLLKEVDLVEEVARIYGYDNIPSTLPQSKEWGALTNGQRIESLTKAELFANGVDEILTYSFISPRALDKLRIKEDSMLRKYVALRNPLGEEYSVMRTSLVPNLLDVMERNDNRKNENVRFFEIGNTFFPKELPVTSEPIEKKSLVIGCYGDKEDFFTLKGIIENVLFNLEVKDFYFESENQHPTYHPGKCANIIWKEHILGIMGELHPLVQENYGLEKRTYVAEIDFNMLLQLAREDKKYVATPKYPAIERDMALLVKDEVTSLQIETVVKEKAGKYLESVQMFDLYKGAQIEEGYKSVAYALKFRSSERTLKDKEVNKSFDQIVKGLKETYDAELR